MAASRRSTNNKVFVVTRTGRLKSILSPKMTAKYMTAKGVLSSRLAELMKNAQVSYNYISVNDYTGEVEMEMSQVLPMSATNPEIFEEIQSISRQVRSSGRTPTLDDFPEGLRELLKEYTKNTGKKIENVTSDKGIEELKKGLFDYWDSPDAIQNWINDNLNGIVKVQDVEDAGRGSNLVIGVWSDRKDIEANNVRSVIKSRIKPLIEKRMTQEMVKRMSNKAELNYAQTWVMIDSKLSEGRLDVMRSASSLKSALENIRSVISEYPEYLEKDFITEEFNEIAGKLDDTVKMLEETEDQMDTWVMRAYNQHG